MPSSLCGATQPPPSARFAAPCRRAAAQLYQSDCELPYGAFFDLLPPAHRAFFDSLAFCLQTRDCICSHGGLDPRIAALADQLSESLMWGDGTFPDGYDGQLPVVYGHWDNADVDDAGWPRPAIIGNTIGIDTIKHGVLTAVRLPDRRVFQSAKYASSDGD
jgi:diadenosine tetraphosphatase ApaH/serine/threonine PP2A family protein phosphatase